MKYAATLSLTAAVMLAVFAGNAYAGVVAVPEPGTLALLAAGFGGLAAVKFFRRK